jgi:ABC-type nitrate/sulfonate/bicarbonate transport system substrate-binding protein
VLLTRLWVPAVTGTNGRVNANNEAKGVKAMGKHKFIIEPHFRLQEWIAEEKGYYAQEGLDYEFRELVQSTDAKIHDKGSKVGAFQSFEEGRKADVSCACHWTVNVAAAKGHGRLNRDVYSVAPSGIFVAPDSGIKTPADLAGVPISVGFQSGSHYATIQALEQYMPTEKINLSFNDGMLFKRMELLLDGKIPAAALFSGPYYFAEQLGFRKIMDNTFMIANMIHGEPDMEDLRKFFRALKRAQRDLDLRPELYTHYYKKEFPVRYHDSMDTRRWGPGERIVFEPYTEETFNISRDWIGEHHIFEGDDLGRKRYEEATVSVM